MSTQSGTLSGGHRIPGASPLLLPPRFNAFHPDTRRPMHRECGFIRLKPDTNKVAFVSAQNTGTPPLAAVPGLPLPTHRACQQRAGQQGRSHLPPALRATFWGVCTRGHVCGGRLSACQGGKRQAFGQAQQGWQEGAGERGLIPFSPEFFQQQLTTEPLSAAHRCLLCEREPRGSLCSQKFSVWKSTLSPVGGHPKIVNQVH